MSRFTRRYKEHIQRYAGAFIQDIFANPSHHTQEVEYAKLDGAELHTMMAYDKKNRVFIIYSADNDDHEWFVFTRKMPSMASRYVGQNDIPGYYDCDTGTTYMQAPPDVAEACKRMREECEAD